MISLAARAEVMERSGGLCEVCHTTGDFRGLSIHHIKPKGIGGTRQMYKVTDLLLVCGKHHSERHHIRESSVDAANGSRRPVGEENHRIGQGGI